MNAPQTSATTAPPGRSRVSGRGLVLAGDRTRDRILARRHSKLVRVLRKILPTSALIMFGGFALLLAQSNGWSEAVATLKVPRIIPEKLAMNNPYYEGFTEDGGRYWVRAATAQQQLKDLSTIKLAGITGELIDGAKKTTKLTATSGTFNSKQNQLELYEAINVTDDDGMAVALTRATVLTKTGVITSTEPVRLKMKAGDIRADTMTLRQKDKDYTFVGNVTTSLQPGEKTPTAATKKPALFAGNDGGPIEIKSSRLDVNDLTKVALFSGGVTASQKDSALTTADLQVTYEGGATPNAKAKPSASKTDGKVIRIVAPGAIELKRGTEETVTAGSGDFDMVNETAVLDGNVVMTQGQSARVTGARATLDQGRGSVVVAGGVIVRQGLNELKGERLQYDTEAGRMQLQGLGSKGRIFATFVQSSETAAKPSNAKPKQQGIPFGANFKSQPGAPVKLEAGELNVDDTAKTAVFTGDVRAIQGNFVLRASKMTARYSGSASLGLDNGAGTAPKAGKAAPSLSRIQARTKVEITSNDGQTATGDWADFDTAANTATLGGNVVLTQGKNVVRGTRLEIDMTTGQSILKSDSVESGARISASGSDGAGQAASGSRPSAVFYPGDIKSRQNGQKGESKASDGWSARTSP